jgi:hypothetical protein
LKWAGHVEDILIHLVPYLDVVSTDIVHFLELLNPTKFVSNIPILLQRKAAQTTQRWSLRRGKDVGFC